MLFFKKFFLNKMSFTPIQVRDQLTKGQWLSELKQRFTKEVLVSLVSAHTLPMPA